MENIRIERTNFENEDFRKLVIELDKYLAVRNGESKNFFIQFNKLDLIRHVIVAYENNLPVGCGAIKEYTPKVMEVKRMFVPVEKREKGVASRILKELESWAVELGYEKCILETGDDMTEAVTLYSKSDYKIIPNYGQYEKVETSICFEKILK